MTTISELIELPDRVYPSDFVLKLAEGVSDAEATVRDYVVTPELEKRFDSALSLIRDAVRTSSSKGTFLHGSFGSGKSHFMAILHLLLQKNPAARSKEELAPVIKEHDDWIQPRKFLLVPYHLIGAKDLETAILKGYAEKIRTLHPEAPTPGFYRSEAILADAANHRTDLGEAKFFERLNEGKGVGGGWGKIAAGWDADSYDRAAKNAPESEERSRLIGDLVDRFFQAARTASDFTDLDSGLAVMTHHAKSLGYDAVILFLDELILWLASNAADPKFVNNESHKLVKLVESQSMNRALPIVSFVARQREMKELVGEYTTGSELAAVNFVAAHQLDRFETITLEDRNLPAIVEKRVVRAKSAAAALQIDDAFAKTTKIREEVLETLMTSHANREIFRKVYPFSPALVETLIAVSFLLQRERTALKVMLQILVDQRDTLKLGDIVPVGDLFDAVAEGNQAFLDTLRKEFDNAKKLYHQKIRPMLEREYGLRFEDMASKAADDPKVKALRNDARLVKTILLAALAPNVESLKNLTVRRLAALNHGTIASPIPGGETSILRDKVRRWAAQVGEIKVGEDNQNPTISVHLSGVDTESILQEVNSEDNAGNRIRRIKEILYRALEIETEDAFTSFDMTWRATKRSAQVRLVNVREASDELLKNDGDGWRILIDYPFDEHGHGPADDRARVEKFVNEQKRAQTIVWLPSFLSAEAQKDLGVYVRLDYLLTGDRLQVHTPNLSAIERQSAKSVFESQRNQLRNRLSIALEHAFGIRAGSDPLIDETLSLEGAEHFQSLEPRLTLKPPVASNLRDALARLFDQALAAQFPGHPLFAEETKFGKAALTRALQFFEQATQQSQGRLEIPKESRKELTQILNPLKVATMYETHLVVDEHWKDHFLRREAALSIAAATTSGGTTTVGRLRTWIDEPQAMGLPKELENLIILAFATQTNRTFRRYGGPFAATLDSLPDELELYTQPLPPRSDWEAVCLRVPKIFGLTMISALATASNVAKLANDIREEMKKYRKECDALLTTLKSYRDALFPETDSLRVRTAREAVSLLDEISAAREANEIVAAVARYKAQASDEVLGTTIKSAAAVTSTLSSDRLQLLRPLRALTDDRKESAESTLEQLRLTFNRDEFADAIAPVAFAAVQRATTLLTQAVPASSHSVAAAVPVAGGRKTLKSGSRDFAGVAELKEIEREIAEAKEESPDGRIHVTWEIYEP